MPSKAIKTVTLAAVVVITLPFAGARRAQNSAKTQTGSTSGDALDRAKTLRGAADALGMVRWSDIGAGGSHLPGVDVVNTMEIWGSGITYGSDKDGEFSAAGPAFKTEYHVSLAYNPPAMRVELTRVNSDSSGSGDVPQHSIQVVREKYAWDESELGAGLVLGKGIATPTPATHNRRLLQLWVLPYGVVKAALAAGDKTKISEESGTTFITFPLSGQLAAITVKATLNARNEIERVETQSDNPMLDEMLTETEYSGYADHGEILTDIKSPGHIIQKQGGRLMLDLQVKKVDANNPYLVFPVPENVKNATSH